MRAGELQAELTATNGWWRQPRDWTSQDPDLQAAAAAPFTHSAGVLEDLVPGGLYVLRGPRRVGKSVELKHTIKRLIGAGADPRAVMHMSVDGWSARDLGTLVRAAGRLMPPDGRRWWLIDEITAVGAGWPAQIKWLRDNDRRFRQDTVVLTGSSSSPRDSIGDLAGRRGPAEAPDRVMLPIGFRTFVELTEPDSGLDDTGLGPCAVADLTVERLREAACRLAPWLDLLVDAWEDYLRVGGFPEAISCHMRRRLTDESLQHALFGAIGGDAFQRARLSGLQASEMLQRLARGLGAPLNPSRLAREIGVSPPTAQRRIEDLCASFVAWPVHREKGLKPNRRAQRKVYFTDPIYARLGFGGTRNADEVALSEQQLAMALLRNSLRHGNGHSRGAGVGCTGCAGFDQVLFYRSVTDAEIDFVGPDFGGLAIESRYSDGHWRRSAGRTLAASPWRGLVATRTRTDLDAPNTVAMPAAMVAWLIDT